ncbi:LutC/YkgG family protein [Basfia succiniciproducens]|uniref:L-lactate dehydrogenase complex protein LldG n=1 Tax=Basfia succiniciproducens TaxID=653940 RepID=A0A1G5BYK1_9PAST|nr:lactate utilization protein C [Basfia succiniciproducens]QIM68178.1 lactate utilization protein B/C [Basfia succiniciproducens]SCX95147.1 L-lactate dehydrogenase complex protein LldG [Basfia succiniciproducens]
MDFQHNREQFLNRLAAKMGKARSFSPQAMEEPLNRYPTERLTELSQAQLCEEFVNFAKVMMVDVKVCPESDVVSSALSLCEKYGGNSVILNDDERLTRLGITQALQEKYPCHIWSPKTGQQNIDKAEKANIGVVYAEYGLAESGGIVLYSQPERGRAVSLLPEKSIVVLRKSQVLPRVAQLAKVLHDKAQKSERMPSCVNIISGPSSTADIELIKVVGVHGPVAKIYLLIDDL